MITKKMLSIVALVGLISFPAVGTQEPESIHWKVAKAILVGAGVSYGTAKFIEHFDTRAYENKMMFLDDLIEYIESPDFTAQHSNDRLFIHYYNGLMQLVQTTYEADAVLLREFSAKPDEWSVLIKLIKDLKNRMRFTHEFMKKWRPGLSVIFGTAFSAYSAATSNDSYSAASYSPVMFGVMLTGKSNIFQ